MSKFFGVVLATLVVALSGFTASAKDLARMDGFEGSLVLTDETSTECPAGSKVAKLKDLSLTKVDPRYHGCWALSEDETVLLFWADRELGESIIVEFPATQFKKVGPLL